MQKKTDLVDDILNGTSAKKISKPSAISHQPSAKQEKKAEKKVEKIKLESETAEKELAVESDALDETIKKINVDEPIEDDKIKKTDSGKGQSKPSAISYQPSAKQDKKAIGQRVVLKELAGRTAKVSVRNDLLYKIKLDEKGVSEPIAEPKIVEKLLKCGYEIYDAEILTD